MLLYAHYDSIDTSSKIGNLCRSRKSAFKEQKDELVDTIKHFIKTHLGDHKTHLILELLTKPYLS
ncbi:hypothetical protein BpHYR1_033162 [Brachionus plicatilis]|uniref:Uncharacterized protein n=1 Tax=Brachionus plicatilis TaxID=10195 RepID=A0A3M7QLN4_BRAPC|nr:hypothetical protein BpHYR1_033162 [Brachionus plicatilis]